MGIAFILVNCDMGSEIQTIAKLKKVICNVNLELYLDNPIFDQKLHSINELII